VYAPSIARRTSSSGISFSTNHAPGSAIFLNASAIAFGGCAFQTAIARTCSASGYRAVALANDQYPFDRFRTPVTFVAAELCPGSEPLTTFEHPEHAVYVFGPEDGGITKNWRGLCHRFVHIQANHCLNLAVAAGCVLAHRFMQEQLTGRRPILPLGEMLHEHRGAAHTTPALDALHWDGQ
jgi:tRNA C32,U32 (ribose-2'-O)-methylase TrmJ